MDINTVLEMDYETQHFGFHPRGFVDGVYNSILDYLRESLDSMQKFLAEEFKTTISKEDVQNRAQTMMQVLTQKLDKTADRLEVFLNRNVFAIPSHVVLPEDRIHITNPTTTEQMDCLDREIAELRLKIIRAKHRTVLLKEKNRQQAIIKVQQMKLVNKYKQLILLASEAGIPDLQESLQYYTTKVQELSNIRSNKQSSGNSASE